MVHQEEMGDAFVRVRPRAEQTLHLLQGHSQTSTLCAVLANPSAPRTADPWGRKWQAVPVSKLHITETYRMNGDIVPLALDADECHLQAPAALPVVVLIV
jgi:hypothetical protein